MYRLEEFLTRGASEKEELPYVLLKINNVHSALCNGSPSTSWRRYGLFSPLCLWDIFNGSDVQETE